MPIIDFKEDGRVSTEIKRIIILTIGAAISAFNMSCFVSAGGLYPSGISGVSFLIQRIFAKFAGLAIPFSALYLPLNIIPIIIGFKFIGKKFTIYSLYYTVLVSVLTDIIPKIAITDDILLICLFGGIIGGASGAIPLFVGASGGGIDFISIYFAEKKGRDVWNYILAFNVCILFIAGILFGLDKAMYSVIYQYCSTQVLKMVYRNYQKHTLLVITDMTDEVYEKISAMTKHDATLFKGTGCYQGAERKMLYSVIGSDEVQKVIKAVQDIDPDAFINILRTESVEGRFYKKPKQ